MGATEQLVQPPTFGETNSVPELLPSLHIPRPGGENGDIDETSGEPQEPETFVSRVAEGQTPGPHPTAWIVQEGTDGTSSGSRTTPNEEQNFIGQADRAIGGSSVVRKTPAGRKSPPARNRQQPAPAAGQNSELSEEARASNDRLAQAMANQDVAILAPENGDAGSIIPLLVDAAQREPNAFALEHEDLMERYAEYLGPARAMEASIFQAAVNQAVEAAQNAESGGGGSGVGGGGGEDSSPTDQGGSNGSPLPVLGGSTTLGDIFDTESMVSWMRQRPGEDHAEWLDRVERAGPEMSEALGRDLFEDRLESFEALSSETGMTISRSDGEISVTLSGTNGRPLFSADPMGMGRLAEVMADDPSIAHIVAGIHDGSIEFDKVEARLAELEALPLGGNRGEPYLTPELRAERDRLRITWDALYAQATGVSPEEVGDILIAGYAPDPQADADAAISLVLNLLPGIGEVGSAMDSVEQYDAMRAALEDGDLEGAAEYGLFTFLSAMGAVPGLGVLGRVAQRIARRVLSAAPRGTWLHSSGELSQMINQRNMREPTIRGEDLIDIVQDPKTRKRVVFAVGQGIGQGAEEQVIRHLEKVRTNLPDGPGLRGATDKKHDSLGRIYDATTPDSIQNILNLLVVPRRQATGGTAVEVKAGSSPEKSGQLAKDDVILQETGHTSARYEEGGYKLVDVQYFRLRLDQIDEDLLREGVTKYLQTLIRRQIISQTDANAVLERVVDLRNQSNGDNPVSLGNLASMLGAMFFPSEAE